MYSYDIFTDTIDGSINYSNQMGNQFGNELNHYSYRRYQKW